MPAVATAGGLPTRLGKYELLMPLAAGGMARIYIGRTTGIGSFERHVVLKLITPERERDQTAVQMFLDEARLAASLNHQNVGQVFEVGEDGGIHYLAMEYVHGQDLRALLAKAGSEGTRVPLELALTVVAGAAAGLNHAHERRGADGVPLGIVHRDVSPSNIMIGYDGSVKLLDFGIAKATARSIETQSGIIKGKFAYMAPEQCRGRDVDRRSDVFSLGIILYEITTQHRCFRADSDFDTMHRIVTGDVVRPTRLVQGYPQALEAIVLKALAVDANQRYQSAGLLLEAIESFAVAQRMSLSTMSLGRFMRDMFGDQTEPWLNQYLRESQASIAPVTPKESTISSTNGAGNATGEPADAPTAIDPKSSGTVLDLPQEPAPPAPPAPNPMGTTVPSGQWAVHGGSGSHSQSQSRSHSQHVAPAPSGPLPLVSTRHGYASAAQAASQELSYPRYVPAPDDVDDLVLKPNRRPLYIGLGLAAIGAAVLLAMTLGADDIDKQQPVVMDPRDDDRVPPASTAPLPSAQANAPDDAPTLPVEVPDVKPRVAPAEPRPAPAVTADAKVDERAPTDAAEVAVPVATGEDASPPPVLDASIQLTINSEPSGADVLLSGKVIGTTPLRTKVPKGTGLALLTLHKARFIDVTKEVDLRENFTAELLLKKVEEAAPATPKKSAPPAKTAPRPEAKKCQPPNAVDPFSSLPVCKN